MITFYDDYNVYSNIVMRCHFTMSWGLKIYIYIFMLLAMQANIYFTKYRQMIILYWKTVRIYFRRSWWRIDLFFFLYYVYVFDYRKYLWSAFNIFYVLYVLLSLIAFTIKFYYLIYVFVILLHPFFFTTLNIKYSKLFTRFVEN